MHIAAREECTKFKDDLDEAAKEEKLVVRGIMKNGIIIVYFSPASINFLIDTSLFSNSFLW